MTDNLKTMTTPELWAALKAAITATAEGLLRMARLWVELESRGEDLSAYRNPMLAFLPQVAGGALLPEVLLLYGGNPELIEAISGLVPEDQEKLTKPDARVKVLAAEGGTRSARLTDLRKSEIRQVLGSGKIRTVAEQQRHLAPAPRTFKTRPGARQPVNAQFDLLPFLDVAQVRRWTLMAEEFGKTPGEFMADAVVSHKILPAKSRKATRAEAVVTERRPSA